MNINLLPYALSWGGLAIVVIALVIYRRTVTSREDDSIHLEGGMATQQLALANRVNVIDRWGKTLTVVVALYGLTLAGLYVYQIWTSVPSY